MSDMVRRTIFKSRPVWTLAGFPIGMLYAHIISFIAIFGALLDGLPWWMAVVGLSWYVILFLERAIVP